MEGMLLHISDQTILPLPLPRPFNSLLASGSDDLDIKIWNVHEKRMVASMNSGHGGNIFSVKVTESSTDQSIPTSPHSPAPSPNPNPPHPLFNLLIDHFRCSFYHLLVILVQYQVQKTKKYICMIWVRSLLLECGRVAQGESKDWPSPSSPLPLCGARLKMVASGTIVATIHSINIIDCLVLLIKATRY